MARGHTLGFFWTNLSRKAPRVRLRSGSPSYTTVVPASRVRVMAATDGCACAASGTSSHQAARSAPQKAGSLRRPTQMALSPSPLPRAELES